MLRDAGDRENVAALSMTWSVSLLYDCNNKKKTLSRTVESRADGARIVPWHRCFPAVSVAPRHALSNATLRVREKICGGGGR